MDGVEHRDEENYFRNAELSPYTAEEMNNISEQYADVEMDEDMIAQDDLLREEHTEPKSHNDGTQSEKDQIAEAQTLQTLPAPESGSREKTRNSTGNAQDHTGKSLKSSKVCTASKDRKKPISQSRRRGQRSPNRKEVMQIHLKNSNFKKL